MTSSLASFRGQAALFTTTLCTTFMAAVAVMVTAGAAKIEAPTVLSSVAPSLSFLLCLALSSLIFFGRGQWKQALRFWTLGALLIAVWNNAASCLFFLTVCRLVFATSDLPMAVWLPYVAIGGSLSIVALASSLIYLRRTVLICRDLQKAMPVRVKSWDN